MDILGYADDGVDVRLSREEASALYNLLTETESWPAGPGSARPFIRQVREAMSKAIGGFPGTEPV